MTVTLERASEIITRELHFDKYERPWRFYTKRNFQCPQDGITLVAIFNVFNSNLGSDRYQFSNEVPVPIMVTDCKDEAEFKERVALAIHAIDSHETREFIRFEEEDGELVAPLHPHTASGITTATRLGLSTAVADMNYALA